MYVWKKIISKFRWHCISVWSLVGICYCAIDVIWYKDDDLQQSYDIYDITYNGDNLQQHSV